VFEDVAFRKAGHAGVDLVALKDGGLVAEGAGERQLEDLFFAPVVLSGNEID
jgi:hypothetical protein